MRPGLYARFGVDAPFDPQHTLVTSPILSPRVLAATRLALGLYALGALLARLVWGALHAHDAEAFFSYFTRLSYVGLLAYLFAAGVQTACFVRSGGRGYPLQRWPRALQFLHLLLYATITTYPIVVTVIYWALLSDSSTLATPFSSWTNISQHALNTVFALFEVLLTNMAPSPWLHLVPCIVMLACYLGVAYITRATQGFYVYSFLDPHKEHVKLAGYIVGVGAAEVVAFVLARYLAVARVRLARRYARARDPTAAPQAIDEWEEVERPKERAV
ncbi:hypothetical protein BD413DRAFT_600712 [Trametes elegans]|nr:hypothetical protein BD413DRAFT_600712 [Trametes elegans]